MKKFLISGLIIFCYITAFAQSKWGISYSPAFPMDPRVRFAVQPGVEWAFNKKLSWLNEFAFTLPRKKILLIMIADFFG
ncbi:MAG: hypothetical protein C4308_04885 [Chitinophagaceae bacterium]